MHIDMYSTFSRHRIEETCQFICLGLIVFLGEIVLKKSLHYEQKTSEQFSVTNPFLEKGLEFEPTVLAEHREIPQNPT